MPKTNLWREIEDSVMWLCSEHERITRASFSRLCIQHCEKNKKKSFSVRCGSCYVAAGFSAPRPHMELDELSPDIAKSKSFNAALMRFAVKHFCPSTTFTNSSWEKLIGSLEAIYVKAKRENFQLGAMSGHDGVMWSVSFAPQARQSRQQQLRCSLFSEPSRRKEKKFHSSFENVCWKWKPCDLYGRSLVVFVCRGSFSPFDDFSHWRLLTLDHNYSVN